MIPSVRGLPTIHGLAACALTLVALSAPPSAWAQGNPSADQIINSLKPGAGMMGGTRGIRPVSPRAPEPAPRHATPAVQSVPAPHTATKAPPASAATTATNAPPSVNLSVEFATNSASLTPAAVKTLTQLGRALSSPSLSAYKFRIEGHTDTAGSADMNKTLSERRAQAVAAFLEHGFKIEPTRLEPVGMGEEGLLVQTPANTPEPRNRRVQVINLGA